MTIWIDLTDLLQWRGNLTGIQRVQFNLAKLYQQSDRDVRFFIHSEHKRMFKEIAFQPDELVHSGIIRNNQEFTVQKEKPKRIVRLRRLLSLPLRIFRRLRIYAKRLIRKLNPWVRSPFSTSDTVLVVGSIWIGGFIDDLTESKKRVGFSLVHFSFDMIPTILPGFVVPWLPKVFTSYHKQVLETAEGIIAISESTARDIKEFASKDKIKTIPPIKVVRIGDSINDKRQKKIKGIKPGFLLSVSTIEARKNHVSLFYAVREAHQRGVSLPKIVIVGRGGWHTEDFRYMVKRDPVARDSIMFLEDANDAELAWLYSNCLFTVFPSFYEGWGMPVAESLAYGKFCVTSNTSSMPEIAGNLVDYFSPYDTGELLDCILKHLDKEELARKEKRIRESYKLTTWNDTFLEVEQFVDFVSSKRYDA